LCIERAIPLIKDDNMPFSLTSPLTSFERHVVAPSQAKVNPVRSTTGWQKVSTEDLAKQAGPFKLAEILKEIVNSWNMISLHVVRETTSTTTLSFMTYIK